MILLIACMAFFFFCFAKKDLRYADLTKEEKLWILNNNPVVVAPTPSFPPIDFFDSNMSGHQGIVKDYLNLISKYTGLQFKTVYSKTWMDSFNRIKNKNADIITSIQNTPERQKDILFTKTYLTIGNKLITGNNMPEITDLDAMAGKILAMPRGYAVETFIRKHYPHIKILYVDHILEGMLMVSMGKAHGIIANIPVLLYYKSINMIGNLSITSDVDYKCKLSFGIRKDSPILRSIMDKGLLAISDSEKHKIYNKWIKLDYRAFWETPLFWTIVSFFSTAVICMSAAALLWRKKAIELHKARLEAEEARQKAESADMAKSKFLASISHEIRTPMNSVLGFAEILKDEIKTETGMTFLNNIRLSGESLLKLIDSLLDLSAMEFGDFKVNYQPVNLRKVLNFVKSSFLLDTKEKGLVFNVHAESDLPEFVLFDDLRLSQVILNLVGNAVKFTSHGYIRVNVFKKDITDNKIELYFEVCDSGIGILESEHENVFKPFVQQDGQDAKRFGGSGLGLALTKKIVENLNGEISLTSRPGFGSIFFLRFSNVDVVDMKKQIIPQDFSESMGIVFEKKAKVVIAAKNFFEFEIMKSDLEPFNFELICCTHEKGIIECVEKDIPDILIIDVLGMENKAYDVLSFLNEKGFIHKLSVILVLEAKTYVESDNYLRKGVTGFLVKPFTKKDLIMEVMKSVPYSLADPESVKFKNKYINNKDIRGFLSSSEFDYNSFINYFDKLHTKKWAEVENSFVMSDIIDFSKDLIRGGYKFGAKPFEVLGRDIKKYAMDFNIEQLQYLMDVFPNLLKQVKLIHKGKK